MEKCFSQTLSVVIPVTGRDCVRLGETLASLAAQTLAPQRIVLIEEDSANEEAHIVCREAAFDDENVSLTVDDRQYRGMDAAINRGIAAVKTSLFALLACGDTVSPEFVEYMTETADSKTDICVSGAGFSAAINAPLSDLRLGKLLRRGCFDSLRGMVFRKALFEDNMLEFVDKGDASAVSLVMSCLMYCRKMAVVKEELVKRADPIVKPSRFVKSTDIDEATAIHARLLSVTAEPLHNDIYEYAYDLYSRLFDRALAANQRSLARHFLKQKLVQLAYARHRSSSPAERVRVMLMRNRLFPLMRVAHLFK